MTRFFALLPLLPLSALSLCLVVACGGSDEGQGGAGGSGGKGGGGTTEEQPCGEHPLSCEAGDTCWFAPSGFACLPSGTAEAGEACAPTVGEPTCADGLLCVKANGKEGACAVLCDATVGDGCGEGLCVLVETSGGAQTHVCE